MTRLIASAVLLASAGFAVWEMALLLRGLTGGFLAFNDFFAQWSFARFVRSNPAAALYDPEALHQFQRTLEPALRQTFPYPYPPSYLFAVWPLGALPFVRAQLAWDGATLLLFALAVRRPGWAFALLAPATAMALVYGQNGLLVSALIVGGMRLIGRHKLLAGLLLGLATIKPQLGLLLPFALVAAREWRVAAWAMASALALVLASLVVFGAAAWPAWVDAALHHAAWLESAVSDYRKPTVQATLSLFGASRAAAQAGQIFAAVVVVVAVIMCCARGMTDLAIAAVQCGTFLALPFAFIYDLPMVANAVLLYAGTQRRLSLVEAGILSLGLLFPAVTTLTTRFFYVNTVALALLFGLIVFRCLKAPRLDQPGRDRTDQDE